MKFLSIKEIRSAHAAIRKSTNKVSRETFLARTQIKNAENELTKLYEKTGMSKTEIKNAIKRDMKIRGNEIAKLSREKINGELREIEKHRQNLEDAREFVGNPLRRINSITALDKTLAPQRAAVAQLLLHAGPAELETIALAAKATGDLATLAACISKNNSIPVSERRIKNQEMLEGVVLPDQREINAMLQEAVSLPAYALSCDRSLNNLGVESGIDRIERGLHDRQVELQADGGLKAFEFEHNKVEVDPDDYHQAQADRPTIDPEDLNPEDFDNPADYMLAGGTGAVVEVRCAELWPDFLAS